MELLFTLKLRDFENTQLREMLGDVKEQLQRQRLESKSLEHFGTDPK
jgi:hypothetical protein